MIKPPAQSSVHLLANRAFICLHKKPSPAGAAEGCVKDKPKFITSCAGGLFDCRTIDDLPCSLSVRLSSNSPSLLPPTLVEAQVEAQFHLVRGFGFAFLVAVLCELCGKKNFTAKNAKDSQRTQSNGAWVWLCVLGGSSLRALR